MSNPGPAGLQPAFHLLRERGISQHVAAAHSGVSIGTIQGVLTGWRRPSAEVADSLGRLLGLPVRDLFVGAEATGTATFDAHGVVPGMAGS
jgi:hypothetical protein